MRLRRHAPWTLLFCMVGTTSCAALAKKGQRSPTSPSPPVSHSASKAAPSAGVSKKTASSAPKKSVTYVEPSIPAGETEAPAQRYGSMSGPSCLQELSARKIPFVDAAPQPGVLAPVRLDGPVRGIVYHSNLAKKDRATAAIEILDCRLLLAIDDFSQMLSQLGVVEAVHYSVFRPNRSNPGAGSKHAGALAMDLAKMVFRDGSVLSVEDDFSGQIGRKTCPVSVAGPVVSTAKAETLWRLACAAHDARLFNVILTPNYNAPHKDHFHIEVTPGVKWFLVN